MTFAQTLLMSDIVDSVRLHVEVGDAAMQVAWDQHDRLSRRLMREWRGRELARSDGFLVLFADASDAVGYALEYHRLAATLTVPMQARAGIHVGPVILRDNSPEDLEHGAPPFEVDGLALPVAARVMAAATGGQTLVTDEVRTSLGTRAGAWRTQSHGHWRVKGVQVPIELFEIGHAEASFKPPPDSEKAYQVVKLGDIWLPRRQIRNTLPAERNDFFGRDAELDDLGRRFESGSRLVSILGTGGTGKTRLAARFGWTWLGEFPGGVWFCDLSRARGLDGIAHAAAVGLEVPLGGSDPIEQLSRSIAGRGRCLVVLDNFEQIVRHADDTLGVWLNKAVEARFVVTTREVVGLPGEEVLNLAPLPLKAGVSLFLRRVQGSMPARPNPDELAVIQRLVTLLDGLPLAIELAAARIRIMSPSMLLQRMSERFTMLNAVGSRRDRQSTLRGVFDWSWDLLDVAEKSSLARLSVFDGGFTLVAAETVLASMADRSAVDVVQALADKSFLRRAGDGRMSMLQSIQEYAAEHLGTAARYPGSGPGALRDAHARHWTYYSTLTERQALADGCVELDNLVGACRRAAAASETGPAVGALVSSWTALRMTGPFRVGVELADVVARMPQLDRSQQATVDWVAGSAAHLMGHVETARARFGASLSASRAHEFKKLQAQVMSALAELETVAGNLQVSESHLQEALRLARECRDPAIEYKSLNGFGALAVEKGELSQAERHYEAALKLAQQHGDDRWKGGMLSNLGALHFLQGRLEPAAQHYEQALELARAVGDRRWEGSARCNLALLKVELGRYEESRAQFEVVLRMAKEMGHSSLEASVLCNLGIVTEAMGDLEVARSHHEAAVSAANALGAGRLEGQFRGYLGYVYARLGEVDRSSECLRIGEDLLAAGADRLSLGMLLCSAARARALHAAAESALPILLRAEAIWKEADTNPASELGRAIDKARKEIGATQVGTSRLPVAQGP